MKEEKIDVRDYTPELLEEDLKKQLIENVVIETINSNAWAKFWLQRENMNG